MSKPILSKNLGLISRREIVNDQCMTCGGPLTNTRAKSLGQCDHCKPADQKLYTQAELDAEARKLAERIVNECYQYFGAPLREGGAFKVSLCAQIIAAALQQVIATAAGAQREAAATLLDARADKLAKIDEAYYGYAITTLRGQANEIRNAPLVTPADAQEWLARHDATVFHTTLDAIAHDGSELVVGGKEPVRIFNDKALEDELAVAQRETARKIGYAVSCAGIAVHKLDDPDEWKREIEHKLAKARLEEAKWWMDNAHHNRVVNNQVQCDCFQCWRIAELEAAAPQESVPCSTCSQCGWYLCGQDSCPKCEETAAQPTDSLLNQRDSRIIEVVDSTGKKQRR